MNLNLPDASNNTSWHELRSLHVPLSHDTREYGSTNCFKVHESVPKQIFQRLSINVTVGRMKKEKEEKEEQNANYLYLNLFAS